MKNRTWLHALQGLALLMASTIASAQSVFINEFHYDNAGIDANEFIEVAGPAGTSLFGWSLQLYSSGTPYDTVMLAGVLENVQNGFGIASVFPDAIQNGPADAIALVNPASSVVQFLSYEGTMTATGGFATGMTSVNIGVDEEPAPAAGGSLQLQGTGSVYSDFTWAALAVHTDGAINTGQTFTAAAIPEPESYAMLLAGLGLLGFIARRRNRALTPISA